MVFEKKFKIFYLFIILLCITSIFYAFFVEFFLGYKPCILCKYQRVPYILGLIIALFGFVKPSNKRVIIFIFLTFLISMTLSGYHVGIEQEFFSESLVCDPGVINENMSKEELLKQLEMNTAISCKDVTFRFLGLSLATINTIISIFLSCIMFKVIKNYGQDK